MNKLKSILLGCLAALPLASCGLMGTQESLYIESVTAVPQEDGSILVTITFTDEDMKPVTFNVPKGDTGEQGPQGVGIASVESAPSEDGKDLVITVTYTDSTLEPSVWEIPNANSIENFSSSYDAETGNTTVTITTSDGEDHTFIVPKGKDGVGIASVNQTEEESGDIVITITYTDVTIPPTEIRLPYKNGEDGRGIAYIESSQDYENYYLTIHYTSGEESQTLVFPLPDVEQGTRWDCGDGYPSSYDNPREGDFYFDYTNGVIYIYRGGNWFDIFSFSNESKTCTVTFNASENGGRIISPSGFLPTVTVSWGESIPEMPIAYKEGSIFLGWYTSKYGTQSPNSGQLTDLTPITRDLTVYACFEEIAP